jgi:MFS family permease
VDHQLNRASKSSSPSVQFRSLAVLIAVAFVDMLGFAMILPLLPFYALDLAISPQLIGLILASFSMAQLLSAPLWGRVSDRYGRRPAMLIGLTASAISYVVFGLATSFWLLLASRLIQGAGGGTTGVLHAYVADTVPPEDRTRCLGWLSAATSAGVMIGPVIGSTAAFWGQAAPGFVAAALCVLNIVFAWGWLRESSEAGEESKTRKRKPVWGTAWTVIRHPTQTLSRLVWIYGLGMLAFSSFTSILALYLGFEFAIDETNIGYIFLYTGAFSVVMRSMLLGPIVARFGETWTMRLGALSLMVGFLTFPFASNFWVLMVLIILVPVGTALTFPSTTALTSQWAEETELGTTLGTAQAFAGMARTVSPLIATALFQQLGHGFPFFAGAFYAAIVVVLSLRVRDATPRKDTGERQETPPVLQEEPAES